MLHKLVSEFESLRAAVDHAFAGGADKVGVDIENRVIYGMVAAELGEFKTSRGMFDQRSLEQIAALINASPDGVVSNWGHQNDVGSSDALNAFLGRAKNA